MQDGAITDRDVTSSFEESAPIYYFVTVKLEGWSPTVFMFSRRLS
jgi:hypothetical protein